MSNLLPASDFAAQCICLGLQRSARAIARRYDEALRPYELTSGQFSILAALVRDAPVRLGALANDLGVDRTTLNRNLRPLQERGLVATTSSELDLRVRGLVLTRAGRDLLQRAMPAWRKAQAAARRLLQPPPERRARRPAVQGADTDIWSALHAHLQRLT